MKLAIHLSNPNRPYMPWQHKLKIQLEELLRIRNPDSRTRKEIKEIQLRISSHLKNYNYERHRRSYAREYKQKLREEKRCCRCTKPTKSSKSHCEACLKHIREHRKKKALQSKQKAGSH